MADVVDFGQPVRTLISHHASGDPRAMTQHTKKPRLPVIELRTLSTPVEPEVSFRSRSSRQDGEKSSGSLIFDEGPSPSGTSRESFEQSTEYLVREFLAYRLKKSEYPDISGFLAAKQANVTPILSRTPLEPLRFPPTDSNVQKVSKALQLLGDHLDEHYWQAFQQTIPADWLEIKNTADVKNKFFTLSRDLYFNVENLRDEKTMEEKKICDEKNFPEKKNEDKFFLEKKNSEKKFEEKIKWGRIIAHFSFTSQLACLAAASNREEIVPELAIWLTQFITRYLRSWIERNGGWEGLISYQETLSLPKKWNDSALNCAFGAGTVAVTVTVAVAVAVAGFVAVKKFLSSHFL